MKTVNDKGNVRLSLGKDDFNWEFFPAGGHGGQKQNKTSSACRCTHPPSRATGISRDERSQAQNKKRAFERCVNTEEFRRWAELELSKAETREKDTVSIDVLVEREMAPSNLLIETQNENGEWIKEN